MAVSKDVREVQKLLGQLSEKLGTLSEDASDEVMDVSAKWFGDLKERATESMDMARTKSHEAMERARKAGTKADEYVHENPWQVIAGAAAIGAVIGYMFSNRR
jgi:ElaB protein